MIQVNVIIPNAQEHQNYCGNAKITAWNARIIAARILQESWNYYMECQNYCKNTEITAHNARINVGKLKLLHMMPRIITQMLESFV